MSEVFRALEQAERDRLRARGVVEPPATVANPGDPNTADADVAAVAAIEADTPRIAEPDATAPHGVDDRLVSLVVPASFEAEQYRALAHAVERARSSAGVSVVAVSSPTPGDGKTVTAINLAGALSQFPDTRVLVIDADVRRPSLAHWLGSAGDGPGLAGAVSDASVTLDRAVRMAEPSRMAVLPSGRLPAAPWELVKSARFKALIAEARRAYDYVVLDTPPMVGLPDCRVIAESVDAFLVVVAAHRTSRRLLAEALTVIDPGKILGLVFNADDRPLAPSGAYAYGTSDTSTGSRLAAAVRRARRVVPRLRFSRGYHETPWR